MTYAGSPLCAAVNALIRATDEIGDDIPTGWVTQNIQQQAEQLRRAHNSALFAEANLSEFPGDRMSLDAQGAAE